MAAAIACMQKSHDRGDVLRFVEADLQFHEILFEAADNAFLEALLQPLDSVSRDLREETSSVPETREHAIDYHGRILGRVDERDTVGAREAMREHLTLTEEYMERFRVRPGCSGAS
jgi:DNA-binding FadR family transcriptional regulator